MKPKITLMNAPSSAAPKLSRYDASTRGEVAAAQKASTPWLADFRKTAPSGISTSSER